MRFPLPVFSIALIVVTLLPGCARESLPDNLPGNIAEVVKVDAREGRAPGFTWRGTDGREVSFDEARGGVTLVNFWATWCGPCKVELPDLVRLSQKYSGRDFRIIGVATDRTPNAASLVSEYVGRYHIPYQVVLSTLEMERAFGNVRQMPTSLLIDREGRIVSTMIGMHSMADFEKAIQPLL